VHPLRAAALRVPLSPKGHPTSSPLRGTPSRCTFSALPRFVFLCRPKGTRHRHPCGAHRPGAPPPRCRASCSSVAQRAPDIVTPAGHTVPVHPLRAAALRVPLSPKGHPTSSPLRGTLSRCTLSAPRVVNNTRLKALFSLLPSVKTGGLGLYVTDRMGPTGTSALPGRSGKGIVCQQAPTYWI